jgi:hypothetical protein
MMRATVLATFSIVLAGCAKHEAPIGYTPSSSNDSVRSEEPPTGGGGFDFGAKVEKVRAKCTAERGKFAQSGQVSTCLSQHAEAGATLITLVEYCRGVACRIHSLVVLDRTDAESWLVPFEHLRRQLQGLYGAPDESHKQFPADCETEFADCVRSGKASATLRWRWDDGHAVMLRLGTTEQVPAAISVSYSDAPTAPTR